MEIDNKIVFTEKEFINMMYNFYKKSKNEQERFVDDLEMSYDLKKSVFER